MIEHAQVHVSQRRRSPLRWGLASMLIVWWMVTATVCRAQFTDVQAPERVVAEQPVNLFATWDGAYDIDGLLVEVPRGWTLRGVRALRYGWQAVPLSVRRRDDGGRYLVASDRSLHGAHELVLELTVGDEPGRAEWRMEPFVDRGGRPAPSTADAIGRVVHVRPPVAGANRVLAFATRDGGSLVLAETALPELAVRTEYTVAAWLRTTGLDEVVLSTWTGDEGRSYPLEMVVDAGGRLAAYRGVPGRHEAMTTRRRVADGAWHHVAVTHEPAGPRRAGGWRLFLDGVAVDSLPAAEARSTPVRGLALGGRLPAGAAEGPAAPFTGALDDVALLARALTPAAVKRHADRPVDPGEQGVLLTFEEPIAERLVARPSPRAERRVVARAREHDPSQLQATLAGGTVMLSWQAPADLDALAVVERSTDGDTFVPITTVTPTDADRVDAHGTAHFSWTDRDPAGGVVFYRVVYPDAEGVARTSGTLKVGRGTGGMEPDMILGNFPNPFSGSTTVSYELPASERVMLSVWDLSGHRVALLVDEVQAAGAHEVPFTAGELPSGTYFVRLRTPTRTDAHKMILMK